LCIDNSNAFGMPGEPRSPSGSQEMHLPLYRPVALR
jgi:hypothetical protein